jgi:hypothetical protein
VLVTASLAAEDLPYDATVRGFVAALALSLAAPRVAVAAPRKPKVAAPAPEIGELSEQGTRGGAVEIGVGTVATGTAVGLLAFGTVQFVRAQAHLEYCRRGVLYIDERRESTGIDACVFDPPPLGFVSAGLSWGFSIALATAGGLLFARAKRVRADARAFDRVSLAPWWRRDGGGGTLLLRF